MARASRVPCACWRTDPCTLTNRAPACTASQGRAAVRRGRETACVLARRVAETSCSRWACARSVASNANEEGAMAVVAIRWGTILAAVAALHVSCNVRAADSPTYKCVYKGRVVYTQIRCGEAKPMGNG